MPNPSPRSNGAESSEDPTSLTNRVAERVVNARLALEAQPKLNRSSSRPIRKAPESTLLGSESTAEAQELRSLKRVFREMGKSYRRYRSQTGTPVVPGLRDAATNFRAQPSFPALVEVAAYLDRLDLLN